MFHRNLIKGAMKVVSVVLTVSIVMPVCFSYDVVNASQYQSVITNYSNVRNQNDYVHPENKYDFPDIVDEEEIYSRGYVGRSKEEEQDLYTFVFENEDGTKTMRVYSHPVKYINDQGETRDITLDIKRVHMANMKQQTMR